MTNQTTKVNKQLIRCPDCEQKGIKQNLAEVLSTGLISIQRIRKGGDNHIDHTIIGGSNVVIICGNCGNIVYKKEA